MMARRLGAAAITLLMLSLASIAHGYNETMCAGERALWMDEYARWHKENRGKPDAKYLVYYCGPGQNLCAGTGDRIRGMLYMLRVAAVHKRVFLAKWTHPLPLTSFLDTAEIDWRTEGLSDDVTSKIGKEHNTLDDGGWFGLAEHGFNIDRFDNEKVHSTTAWPASIVDHRVWNTNLWNTFGDGFLTLLGPLGGVPREPDKEQLWLRQFTWYIDISSCWFHFAFKPTAGVEQRTQELLTSVYGSNPWSAAASGYLAWHWRTGGQHGEDGLIRAENTQAFRPRLQQLMSSRNCLDEMQKAHGVRSPTVIVTDLNPMRTWVRNGMMGPGITALPSEAQHIDMGGGQNEHYLDVFAEALVLARATCTLVSQSGFSNTALMMRKEPLCYMHMDVCLLRQEGFYKGISVRRQLLA